MDVTLLFPPTANPAPSYFGPPYGLALLGALLERGGHRPVGYDYDRGSVKDMLDDLERVVREDRPGLVGISCLSVNRGPAELAAKKLKALAPDVPVIFGGPFPTLEPEMMLRRTPADFVCIGDGDETLLELIDALEQGRDVSTVPGLAYRVNGEARRSAERARFTDLDSLPFPKLDLFPIRKMIDQHRLTEQREHLSRVGVDGRQPFVTDALLMVMGSRGCPWQCSFCPLSKWEGRTLFHSPKYIVDQIQHYQKQFDYSTFVFGDNTLTYPQKQIIEICDLLIERKLGIEWICMTRADMVTTDVLEHMAAAGCKEISYGIESLSQTVQKAIRKKLSVKRVPPAFELTHQAGITSCIMLMVGNQGESRTTMRETIAMARELQPDRVLINTTKVYPGTYLWDAALEQGVVGADYFEGDPEVNPFDLAPEYTGENDATELRQLERMLQHRTTFISVADGERLRDAAELEGQLLMAAWRGEQTVLGGPLDPVSHPDLQGLLGFAKARDVHHLALHTPATKLDKPTRRMLSASGMVERLIVPLYSIRDKHHDGRVRVEGALREARKGMLGWTRETGRVTVWAFVDRYNVSSLSEWPAWLKQHGVDQVVFIYGQCPAGWHGIPVDELPTLAEAGREVRRAAAIAPEYEVQVLASGIPECLLSGGNESIEIYELGRPFDEGLESDAIPVSRPAARRAQKSLVEACDTCTVVSGCEGVWNAVLERHGSAEIQPCRPPDARRHLALVASS